MSKDTFAHRWAIDSIEDGVARVEEDGKTMRTVPAWLLPTGAAEGQLLDVSRVNITDGCTITVTIDAAATAAAIAASADSVNKMSTASRKRDAGGDVAL